MNACYSDELNEPICNSLCYMLDNDILNLNYSDTTNGPWLNIFDIYRVCSLPLNSKSNDKKRTPWNSCVDHTGLPLFFNNKTL